MKTYCENPLCDTEAITVVEVSVKNPADEKRSLCACCEEVFIWGVQHGKKLTCSQKLWILAIADRGVIAYAEAYPSKKMAEQGLIDYLREEENYDGQDDIGEAGNWLAEHDECLSAEIFAAEPCKNNDDNGTSLDTQPESDQLCRFLDEEGFIVLGKNQHDPHPGLEFEAWAYQGPLDFTTAAPITFGSSGNIVDALTALNEQLEQTENRGASRPLRTGLVIEPPPQESGTKPLWRVIYTIDVNAPDADQAAIAAYQIMKDPESWVPVLDVMDSQGDITRIDLSDLDSDRGKGAGHV